MDKKLKKILIIALTLLAIMTLIACDSSKDGDDTDNTGKNDSTASTTQDDTTDSSDNNTQKPDDGDGIAPFKVHLSYNGAPFTSTGDVPITVNWNDGISYFDAEVDENGTATVVGLDGDYQVSLKNLPSEYTYNPNIYVATNDKPEITIEILKLGKLSGSGTNEYNRKVLKTTSMYRAELKSDSQKIYFEFKTSKSGTYTIESWVSVADDKINPKVDVYTSNFAAPIYRYTLDGGGLEGRYTKNFKYEVEIADEMISTGGQVVFVFAVYATARNDKYYPATVDFAVQYEGGFELDHIESEYIIPEELYSIVGKELKEMKALSYEEYDAKYGNYYTVLDALDSRPDYDLLQSAPWSDLESGLAMNVLLNKGQRLWAIAHDILREHFGKYYEDIDGKAWRNPATTIGGNAVLIGTDYRYNENTGFYHKYSEADYASDPYGYGAGFGPVIYADITSPTRTGVLDSPFTAIEYHGNKNLSVNKARENYKFFIESYSSAQSMSLQVYGGYIECSEDLENLLGYADIVNSDGAAPVTRELMEFLQKYATSQVLFMDGDGWAENGSPKYEATENDQWLFACGYYE